MQKAALLSFLKTRWVLLFVLLVFICFKIPHLYYPFYCDEGWVYAPAVKTMAANGPSLLPGVIPASYSRGHPLLFHFLCALWIKCFGLSDVAVHSFPLLISVLCLIAIFEGCLRMFGIRVATMVLLLITTQVFFFVQSSFVLPEVSVAMLTFLSLYYYSQDRLLLTSVMLFMLFFMKESGLVFGAVIGADALVSFFTKRGTIQTRVLRLVAVSVPAMLMGVFYMLQKAKEGWYLFPLHSSIIHTDWNSLYFWLRTCLRCIFWNDPGTSVLFIFIAMLGIIPAIRRKNVRYLVLILPAVIVYIFSNKKITDNTGDVIWVALFVLFFTIPFIQLFRFNKTLSTAAHRFLLLLGCSLGAYLFFSLLSTVTYRYLIVEIILLFIFLAVFIDAFVIAAGKNIFYLAIAGIVLIGAYAFYSDEGTDDTDLAAFHAMKVQKRVVAFLEKANAYDKEIAPGYFWGTVHFIDTTEGFLSSGRTFTKINWDVARPQTDYVVFDNVYPPNGYDDIRNNPAFHLVYRTTDGNIWAEIYKHN
jgi:hypothetical protein